MSLAVQVAGAALIQVDTGAAYALEDLGYTANGVDIEQQARWLDVPGDEFGGEAGVPLDAQYMGEMHIIRIDLTKYDPGVVEKLAPRLYGGTAGSIGVVGTLALAGSKTFRVLIKSANAPRNYLRCIPREPIALNKGSRFSRLQMTFEAHRDGSGVLYNSTIS